MSSDCLLKRLYNIVIPVILICHRNSALQGYRAKKAGNVSETRLIDENTLDCLDWALGPGEHWLVAGGNGAGE